MKNFIYGMAGSALIGVILAFAIVMGGWFPVAAFPPEPPLVANLIHTAYEKAVTRASRNIAVPADLASTERIQRGAYNFQGMCAGCHTPPGQDPSVQVQGMNPRPPDMQELLAQRNPAEAFWVIKNGVRMTAMPAFGPSHEDDELWALTAFLQASKTMSSAEYDAASREARVKYKKGDGHAHSHGPSAGTQQNPMNDDHDESGAEHAHTGPSSEPAKTQGHHDAEASPPKSGHADTPHEHGSHPHPESPDTDQHTSHEHPASDARASPSKIADELFTALRAGDEKTVRQLLDPAVLIFESGGAEAGLEDYAAHHMPHDMTFLATLNSEPVSRQVFDYGDHAIVASRSRLRSDSQGKRVNLLSTETLLLERQDTQWRVAHVHWSSGAAQ